MKTTYQKLFFILLVAVLLVCGWGLADKGHMKAKATEVNASAESNTEQDTKVKPVSIDYDALWLKVDANGNSKVYYADKSKKIWYEAKPTAEKVKSGETEIEKQYYYIDISWLSSTTQSVIHLKGDKAEEVVSIELPARNSKLKAKYDKANAVLTFENFSSTDKTFEWRKTTSYVWNTAQIENGKSDGEFQKEMEKLRISGASIYVRLPQTPGSIDEVSGEFKVGARQSKEIKISITKLAAAPKVSIDGTKLLLNTNAKMEYSKDNGKNWNDLEAKVPISKIASETLYTYTFAANGTITGVTPPKSLSRTQSVNILIRTKATATKAASKSLLLTIPAQRSAPSTRHLNATSPATAEVLWSFDTSKFYMNFTRASKTEPYEYKVVKIGTALDLTKGWKAVTAAKTISISARTAPAGSIIYVRKKTINANTKNNIAFEIASAYMTIPVSYAQVTPTP